MVLAEFRHFREKYVFNRVMATDGWLQMDGYRWMTLTLRQAVAQVLTRSSESDDCN